MQKSKKFDVYAIGNAIMDLQLTVSNEELANLGLAKGGMKLVSQQEQAVLIQKFSDREMHKASGGSAANSIIALSQLGANPAFSCVVADDELGRFYLEEMSALGVTLHNAPIKNATTGTCVILITPDAERTMNTHLGVSATLNLDHVNQQYIKESAWLFIEGYLLSSEGGRVAALQAVKWAREYNTQVALTFSDAFIVECFREALDEIVESADLIFANAREVEAYTGISDESQRFEKFSHMAPYAIMTLSERGALIKANGNSEYIPSFSVAAVDETGAGDMFAGAFLYGITHGKDIKQSTRLACFLASQVVAQVGPRLKLDVPALCKQHGID